MFYRLILAHLVGDFVLQNRWIVLRKRTLGGLAIHVALVGLAMLLVMWDQLTVWWPWMLVVLTVHGATDWAKVRLEPRLHLPPILPFLIDQMIHVLTIAAVVALADLQGSGLYQGTSELVWWVASVYLIATYAISIALPLWLDPPSLMCRPLAPRLTIIIVSALVLTLAWRGLPMLIPVVGLGLYQGVVRRLAQSSVTPTFAIEFFTAVMLAACLGWGLL